MCSPSKYLEALAANLQLAMVDERYSDVTFKLESEVETSEESVIVKAHRIILATRCPYFDKMFSSGMKESKQEEVVLHGT